MADLNPYLGQVCRPSVVGSSKRVIFASSEKHFSPPGDMNLNLGFFPTYPPKKNKKKQGKKVDFPPTPKIHINFRRSPNMPTSGNTLKYFFFDELGSRSSPTHPE
jgi:hypothetical protein